MKSLIIALSALLLLWIAACNNSQPREAEIEKKALSIADRLDTATLRTFYTWNYGRRGELDIWLKQVADSTAYACSYRVNNDTVSLTISSLLAFFIDFPTTLTLDPDQYPEWTLSRYKDRLFRVRGYNPRGGEMVWDSSVLFREVFARDPFQHFEALNRLKDSLGVSGISYRGDIGNFLSFTLSSRYQLIYLPHSLYLNPKSSDRWRAHFKEGKMIRKYWNLIRLEEARSE